MTIYTDDFILEKNIPITHITTIPTSTSSEVELIYLFIYYNFGLPPTRDHSIVCRTAAGWVWSKSRRYCLGGEGRRKAGPHTDLNRTLIGQISVQFTLLTLFFSSKQ